MTMIHLSYESHAFDVIYLQVFLILQIYIFILLGFTFFVICELRIWPLFMESGTFRLNYR